MKIYVVVDMQNDFITGSLGSDVATKIPPRVVEKLSAMDPDTIVITTQDSHGNPTQYLHTKEGEKLPVPHCEFGTRGWDIEASVEEMLPENTIRIYKPTFGSTELVSVVGNLLEKYPIDEIVLFGLDTDICVLTNAMLMQIYYGHEVTITVDSHCCAGSTFHKNNSALDVMRSCQIGVI